jgi:hypothetical protein
MRRKRVLIEMDDVLVRAIEQTRFAVFVGAEVLGLVAVTNSPSSVERQLLCIAAVFQRLPAQARE